MRDKTVLVTGAAGGIGRAVAAEAHRRGSNVVLTDVDADAVREARTALGERGTLGIELDVTDPDACRDAVARSVEAFGHLDVVVANAGIATDPPQTALHMADADFRGVVEVDLFGVWNTVRAGLPQIAAHGGYVMITSSIYAFVNGAINVPYAMSKAAVEQLGRALRVELAAHGATAGVLYPGWVSTGMTGKSFTDDLVARFRAHAFPGPLGREVPAAQVARAAVDGIEKRAATVVVPRIWRAASIARVAVAAAVERRLAHDHDLQSMLTELEARPGATGSTTPPSS